MKSNSMKYALAILAGMAVVFAGDWLLGVRVEVFSGIATFTFSWMLAVFFVPFLCGMAVSRIVRSRMGKWLAFLPPFFARCLTYAYMYWFVYRDGQDFFYHLKLYYWGPMVILEVEFSNLGGMLGDMLFGAYGKRTREPREPSKIEPAHEEPDEGNS